jgi:hypothetical protein
MKILIGMRCFKFYVGTLRGSILVFQKQDNMNVGVSDVDWMLMPFNHNLIS